MKNLDLQQAANALALETVTTALAAPAVDAAIAAKAIELTIADAQYVAFKTAVNNFRQIYSRAQTQDAQVEQVASLAAARAKAATPEAQPTAAPAA